MAIITNLSVVISKEIKLKIYISFVKYGYSAAVKSITYGVFKFLINLSNNFVEFLIYSGIKVSLTIKIFKL